VQDALFEGVLSTRAPRLLAQNLRTMATDLAKLKGRPEEARAYIAKALKEYGLTLHAMPSAKTTYLLDDDPQLKPLKGGILAEARSNGNSADMKFTLLQGVGVYDPKESPAGRLDFVKEAFLWWRAEDLPAKELPFKDVVARVEAAWRFEK